MNMIPEGERPRAKAAKLRSLNSLTLANTPTAKRNAQTREFKIKIQAERRGPVSASSRSSTFVLPAAPPPARWPVPGWEARRSALLAGKWNAQSAPRARALSALSVSPLHVFRTCRIINPQHASPDADPPHSRIATRRWAVRVEVLVRPRSVPPCPTIEKPNLRSLRRASHSRLPSSKEPQHMPPPSRRRRAPPPRAARRANAANGRARSAVEHRVDLAEISEEGGEELFAVRQVGDPHDLAHRVHAEHRHAHVDRAHARAR